jgi:hypothetical protein
MISPVCGWRKNQFYAGDLCKEAIGGLFGLCYLPGLAAVWCTGDVRTWMYCGTILGTEDKKVNSIHAIRLVLQWIHNRV